MPDTSAESGASLRDLRQNPGVTGEPEVRTYTFPGPRALEEVVEKHPIEKLVERVERLKRENRRLKHVGLCTTALFILIGIVSGAKLTLNQA